MKRETFNNLIGNAQFKKLFIEELGWYNPTNKWAQLPPIEGGEVAYNINNIAVRNGFQILICPVEEIPASSICRKIDTRLRRQAHDYICIYYIPETTHHLWVCTVKTFEKRDLVFIEYNNIDNTQFLFQKMDGLTFRLGEETPIMDVLERVEKAFVVNSEKITKDFYTGFRKMHDSFANFISGIDDEIKTKDNRQKQWYTSVMLNRLMFCYFIQKKGFLNNDKDYLSNKLRWVQQERGKDKFFGTFYKGFLIKLFHGKLNEPHNTKVNDDVYGRIPYLNGGMFDVHQIEREYKDIDIRDEAFESIFAFFDKWQWHLDTRITASGKDINPDVLGYIFEQYINDRAAMGAYYTKEDITEYIAKNCILPRLVDMVADQPSLAPFFKPEGYVWKTVKESGDKYIYSAVKKGYSEDWASRIPDYIACGIDTQKPDLLERRKRWNEKAIKPFALPTEIWRETVERMQRCDMLIKKIRNGEITQINDFITYNLDIRRFAFDLIEKVDDHRFIRHFYHLLQKITILDPTCGSGAFLFAALNILEPLYETCIDRMKEFNEKNKNLFTAELAEIEEKYRSNIQYFIYKSIILRNLYGVDIMAEAVEIAKLRLFLKMVAVVNVNFRDENLGLDPLPDVDFNIRCGNTLVGYANQEDVLNNAAYSDFFAAKEFRAKIESEMQKVALTYQAFKTVQLTQNEDMKAYKDAKNELNERLASLNDLLNKQLHKATAPGVDYNDWLYNYQPFHWIAEFYDIIHGNRGFDVIIGNPPYVSMKKINYLKNTKAFSCSDLYGHVIKRALELLSNKGTHGFIVMHNLAFSHNFDDVRKAIRKHNCAEYYSFYSRIPSGLFSGDTRVRNCIYLLYPNGQGKYTSRIHRWFTEQREKLFATLKYSEFKDDGVIPMLEHSELENIYRNKSGISLQLLKVDRGGIPLYLKDTSYNYINISCIIPSAYDANGYDISLSKVGIINIEAKYFKLFYMLSNSKLILSKWLTYGDDFHLKANDILDFCFPFDKISDNDNKELEHIYNEFVKELPSTLQYKLNAGIKIGTYNTKKLWHIINKSDMIFYKYLSDDPVQLHELVESHIALCVVTDRT